MNPGWKFFRHFSFGIVRSILANTQWEEFSEGILVLRLAEDQSALYTEEILPEA